MYQINWGDLSPELFLREYWQKKPLLIRGAFPDMQPLLEPDELAGLALEPEVESRLISYQTKGNYYTLRNGPFSEQDFSELPESCWTLLVQAVDHYIDEASELIDCFSFIPRWRIDDLMISYATPGGGVGPHYDNYDVFLLQASGTRRWELGGSESSRSPRIPNLPLMILSEFEAQENYELQPGDMLYLPPQIAHNGIATSADCMTYSIGFRAPSDAEMLRSFSDFVGEKLSSEQRYVDPDLTLSKHPGGVDKGTIERIQTRLNSIVNQPEALVQWFGRYITEAKYIENIYQPEDSESEEWFAQLALDAGVCAYPGSRLVYIEQGEQLLLFSNGAQLSTSACDREWIIALCDNRESGPVPQTEANTRLLTELFKTGALL